jgi:2'-5' RNA ligase
MSSGATARLFVAVELPVTVRERLCEWGRGVAVAARAGGLSPHALKLVAEDSMHLTLCFLGSRPVGEVQMLAAALAGCDEGTCELSLGAPLWLPPRRPQALAVEVHDRDGALAGIQQRIAELLAAVSDWSPESRRFRPHVTVARIRAAGRPRARDAARRRSAQRPELAERPDGEWALPPTPRLGFAAAELVLYRSRLAPQGARYEQLAGCQLASC